MAATKPDSGSERPVAGRFQTMLMCFLAQNMVLGLGYGSFGPLLAANQAHLDVSRAAAAAGISMITLATGVLAPLTGGLLQRYRVRDIIIAGVGLSGSAYLLLAVTDRYGVALLCYGMVGTGMVLAAILAPVTLVTRWVDTGRGKVLSLVNLPVALFVAPYLIGIILPAVGRTAVLLGMGAVSLALIPLVAALVREWPPGTASAIGRKAAPANGAPRAAAPGPSPLAHPGFWLEALGIALMAGTGVVFMVHIVPFGMGRGHSLGTAAGLISTYAGAGLLGTLFFGWIVDRLGSAPALVLSAATQACMWWLLLLVDGPAMFAVVAILGMCCSPMMALHGAALGALFGANGVSRAMGYSFMVKLPFIFGYGPAAGVLFDLTGGYALPFMLCAASLGLATLSFAGLTVVMRRGASGRVATA
ncbi:CynX/NimT family MFS transporter [Sphingomonas profundi]|uniref:MFS transporter n=1 Tax=Alterirhizorhabdus profundi TaxID=2681549 RepID=UPI0018D0373F|nr:MFS transporter [Sphingomonas profundi]